jgi:glutaredoxin
MLRRTHDPSRLAYRAARDFALALLACSLIACSEPNGAATSADVEQVPPPFEVRGEAEELLLVWFDAEGPHTASSRSEIPPAHRERVRVEDLSIQTDDPEHVFVADLREEGEDGYPVRRVARAELEAWIEAAASTPAAADPDADPDAEVILYGASWCNACRGAAAYLRERDIDFVERDIEREPGAREEMMRTARAAGVTPRGIPVIDFRGEVITGFDRAALQRAILRSAI